MAAPANACTCSACRSACKHKPGWFMPDQIAPLAEAMKLTEQQLFDKHLQVDWWEGINGGDVFVLSPAVVTGTPGEMFDRNPTGTCRWFKRGRCAIHELGKPYECAALSHDTSEGADDRHEAVAVAWNTPENQAKIAQLLGRKPEATGSWGLFDMLASD